MHVIRKVLNFCSLLRIGFISRIYFLNFYVMLSMVGGYFSKPLRKDHYGVTPWPLRFERCEMKERDPFVVTKFSFLDALFGLDVFFSSQIILFWAKVTDVIEAYFSCSISPTFLESSKSLTQNSKHIFQLRLKWPLCSMTSCSGTCAPKMGQCTSSFVNY